MKSDQWPGLVTNASPFAIPPTAAVEQLNLASHVPGQVSVRGGMQKVNVVGGASSILDCYPCERDGKTTLISLFPDGSIRDCPSPAYGWSPRSPYEPNLSKQFARATSSYTYRYADGEVDSESFPSPDTDSGSGGVPETLDGGDASSAHPVVLDANESCAESTLEYVDGGAAGTLEWSSALSYGYCPEEPVAPVDPEPPEPPVGPPPVGPDALSAPLNLSAAFGNSSATLTWLPPTTGTPTYYVVQISLDGQTWAFAPGAPTNVQVTFGNTSAALSWTPPASNNAPITAYSVEYSLDADTWTPI